MMKLYNVFFFNFQMNVDNISSLPLTAGAVVRFTPPGPANPRAKIEIFEGDVLLGDMTWCDTKKLSNLLSRSLKIVLLIY